MQIRVFETYYNSTGETSLNAFLAQDGIAITVDKIFTAASGTEHSHRHYVTVVYYTNELAPREEG